MLVYNFERVFKARGVNRPFSFLKKAGFSDNFAAKVTNKRVMRLNQREIERLCVLLHCTPNDFYEWEPDDAHQVSEDHPLYSIKKTDKVIELTKTLNAIPLDQLNEIERLIQEQIKAEKE